MDKDIQLSKDVIKKVRELLSPQFDYIVDFAPTITFFEDKNEFHLQNIVFESGSDYQDVIEINEDGEVLLVLEEGGYRILFCFESFEDILNFKAKDVAALDNRMKSSVSTANQSYIKSK